MRIAAGLAAIAIAGSAVGLAAWPRTASAATAGTISDPEGMGGSVQILSQVPEADLKVIETQYLPGIVKRTKKEWFRRVPGEARAPELKRAKVFVEFVLHADGTVDGIRLIGPSNDVALDRAAWEGIANAAPFARFPKGISVKQIKLRFLFLYNEKASVDTGISG